jgi:hypothetical protein
LASLAARWLGTSVGIVVLAASAGAENSGDFVRWDTEDLPEMCFPA